MMHTIVMPDLGQTTAEGKILKWLKNPGERVSKGDHLLEVETDKVTMEVESYLSGYLRQVLAAEGQMVSAMAPIALVSDTREEPLERPEQRAPGSMAAAEPVAAAPRTIAPSPSGLAVAPAARTLAKELGIDLALVPGTGPGGLITRKDVEGFAPARATSKPMAAMAALVTRSMQTIPHFYLTADVDVSAAERWREQWNTSHPDLRATLNDVFARAASQALHDIPRLNVSYGEGKYEPNPEADILLVVALESGLALVPVADPGRQSWEECLRSMHGVLERAKQGRVAEAKIAPLLAVSNLGMFRVKEFSAIIPPSCTAALAVGAARDVPVVRHGEVQVGRVATLTLSADHRVVDGITAANFMEKIQEHLNKL
ncbi:MAG: dihydrolipoamide acetyltransferase family protein [Terriglobia bacterium]